MPVIRLWDMRRRFFWPVLGSIASGIWTIASLILDLFNVASQLSGHDLVWQWFALAGFLAFAGFMIWMVAKSSQDQASIEIRKDYLKQHLEEIRALIERWKSEISTPDIHVDYSELYTPWERDHLFGALEAHLPIKKMRLWGDYESWKARSTQLVDSCRLSRVEIRQSWGIEEVKISRTFEQPIMELLSGQARDLRYQLWVLSGHYISDFKSQQLAVNKQDVTELSGTFDPGFEHDKIRSETLPVEYQRIADQFLKSDGARNLVRLHKESVELESAVRNLLDKVLLASVHARNTCEYCRRLV